MFSYYTFHVTAKTKLNEIYLIYPNHQKKYLKDSYINFLFNNTLNNFCKTNSYKKNKNQLRFLLKFNKVIEEPILKTLI